MQLWGLVQVSWRAASTLGGVPRLMQPRPLAWQALGGAQSLRCRPVRASVLRLAVSLNSQGGQRLQGLRRHCL